VSKLDAQYADEAMAGRCIPQPPPPAERPSLVRGRMADLIFRRATMSASVTRDDLRSGGFTEAEIDRHFRPALRAARVSALAVEG
jgi:hypothetical protein